MEGLGFDYIFGENEIDNLFTDDESSVEETTEDAGTKEIEDTGEEENVETSKETTEVDPDDLFGEEEEEKPESVGSGKDKEVKEKEVSPTDDGGGTSPNENFYSSIANAVAVDGGFPNLDEETILVLDGMRGSITEFSMTDYGKMINEALLQYKQGYYDKSAEIWKTILQYNGNFELAYVGIGRSLLRQEKYEEAMDYFERAHAREEYGRAFKQYRKIWVG